MSLIGDPAAGLSAPGELMSGDHVPDRLLRSYGRRHGRKLRPRQQELVDQVLPRFQIPPTAEPVDPAAWFGQTPRDFWLEIGFGGGEHLAAQAARHPEIGFIGCEPFINGTVKLLAAIEKQGLQNIRLWLDDARDLMPLLPTASIGRAYLLFPDPWPKPHQLKRRLFSDAMMPLFARLMKPGAELRLASDHSGYIAWMLEVMHRQPCFEWMAEGPEDFLEAPPDWVRTRYQQKTEAAGRRPTFLTYARRASDSLNVQSIA